MLEDKLGKFIGVIITAAIFGLFVTSTNNENVQYETSNVDDTVITEEYTGDDVEVESHQGVSLSSSRLKYEGDETSALDASVINKLRQDLAHLESEPQDEYTYIVYGGASSHNVGESTFEGNEKFKISNEELTRFKNDLKNPKQNTEYTYRIYAGMSVSGSFGGEDGMFHPHYEGYENVTFDYDTMVQLQRLLIK